MGIKEAINKKLLAHTFKNIIATATTGGHYELAEELEKLKNKYLN